MEHNMSQTSEKVINNTKNEIYLFM